MCIRDRYIEVRGEILIIETRGGSVREVSLRITLQESSVIDVERRRTVSGTKQLHNRAIQIREENMVAAKCLEVVEMSPGVEVGTHRVVQPLNRKTREDNGGGDPAIANR